MLGVSGCTGCLVQKAELGNMNARGVKRSMAHSIEVVRAALACAAKGYGFKTKARRILRKAGLTLYHLDQWNPFFRVPFADYECFPMDRLHGL